MAAALPPDLGAFVPDGRFRLGPTGSGALDGLTFAVKDLIDVAGHRTGAGTPAWLAQQRPAERSAPVVAQALAAGATLVGKTVTDELAFSLEGRNGHYGTPVNPACPDCLPGGSSSGSAVAVAAGLADFALGTDTGGSVRVPASFVGVFGMRPTHGAVPLEGVVPFAPSYDTVGWFARSPEMLKRVGAALLPAASRVGPIRRLLLAQDAFSAVDEALRPVLLARAEAWPLDGRVAVLGREPGQLLHCYRTLQDAEAWRSLGAWIETNGPRLAEDIAERFAGAAKVTLAEVQRQAPIRAAIRCRLKALLPPDTALLIPAASSAALPMSSAAGLIGDFYFRTLTLTSLAGHAGAPQIAVPVGRWQGRPIGLSLIAAPDCDHALLDFVSQLAARSAAGEPA